MKEKAKKLSKAIIFAIVCAAVIGSVVIALIGMQIAFVLADKVQCWSPDYEMTDIKGILEQDVISDEDYETLYMQTGLTRAGVDRMLANGSAGVNRIIAIQTDYFSEHKVSNDYYGPFICSDYINHFITNAYLEDGDIIVSSSTHFSGWRIGHAGLVTDAKNNEVLQASAVGESSEIGYISDFTDRINFMILSPKADKDTKDMVVKYALENLTGRTYNAAAGVLTSKLTVEKTQCAHLVWYAYNQFGIDLDCNGGKIVTPRNLANSPQVELVQVFGIDPIKLWK